MKKKILIMAKGSKEWIGGIYYIKNILFNFVNKDNFNEKYIIYILVSNEFKNVFSEFEHFTNIVFLEYKQMNYIEKIINKLCIKILKQEFQFLVWKTIIKEKIDLIFPITTFSPLCFNKKAVFWIPDFQHLHYPDFFSEKEIIYRNKMFTYIAKKHNKLILSSKDAYNDYSKFFSDYNKKNVFIMPFVSYIEKDIMELNTDFENNVIEKYGVPSNYFYLPNQFWKHKNHMVVFEAMNIIINKMENKDITLVCTGNTNDYRNKAYFSELSGYIKKNNLEKNILILGMIERREQLVLFKHAKFVLQPSLFEGWGTVVEDAKVFNKTILLSDIPVHYEQSNKNCVFFKRDSVNELLENIIKLSRLERKIDIENGIRNMYQNSKKYSEVLEHIFE